MANVAVTNTFVAGTTAVASQVNSNFTDLVSYINNRNSGSATWDYMKVSSTASNPVDIASSSTGSTELSINNTATDGDPILTFKLSGAQTHVIGVDDSDSDFLKFATTAITTNVAMQIPTVGAQVQFASGTVSLPGISFLADVDTGIYRTGISNVMAFSNGGVQTCIFDDSNNVQFSITGSASAPTISFIGDTDTGIYRTGSNAVGFATGGTEVGRFDASVTAADTRFLLYDVTAAALVRVSRGASDSGGVGFRVLRIPN